VSSCFGGEVEEKERKGGCLLWFLDRAALLTAAGRAPAAGKKACRRRCSTGAAQEEGKI
jgi:hypothetical protein